MKKQIRFFKSMVLMGLLLIGLFGLITINFGCSSVHGKINGVLLDSKTGKPIQGAAVVVVYYVHHSSLGGASYSPEDALEMITGPDGRFISQGRRVFGDSDTIWDRIYFFEPNYEFIALNVRGSSGKDIFIGAPVVSTSATNDTLYEIRLSHLETDKQKKVNAEGVLIDELTLITKMCPKFMNMINAERHKFGLKDYWSPWH
jgi:hypothetical protein